MTEKLLVPDIGEFQNVEVIELLLEEGQKIKRTDAVVTLETDKSSVEVASRIEVKKENTWVMSGDNVQKDDYSFEEASKEIPTPKK